MPTPAMRRLCVLLAASCALLAACGSSGGSGNGSSTSSSGGTPHSTRKATKTPTGVRGGPTPVPTDTAAGGTRRTPTPRPDETPAQNQTLYVRESGNDDNPGTSPEMALKTVARAAQLLAPGTTVYVGPGHYTGRVEITGVEGTADAPIQLIADPTGAHTHDAPGAVTLDAAGDTSALVITKSPYVTADSFVITGAVPQMTPKKVTATEVLVRTTSSNVTISNCVIGQSGMADGIRVDGSSDALIFDNLLFQNDRGLVITGDAPRAQVINNTIATSQRAGIVFTQKSGAAPTDGTVMNNIVQGNENNLGINVDPGPPDAGAGYSGDFNLVFEPGVAEQSKDYKPPGVRGTDDINDDAQFVNLDQGDVHLAPGSPAVNKGSNHIDAALLNELFKRSTLADGSVDKTPVDMGYHYPREQ